MNFTSNPWLARVAKHLGEANLLGAVEALVCRFRNGQSLDELTRQLGVERVVSEAMPFDGGIYEIDGRRIIKLNSLCSPAKQRFTLAHELGHLMLESTTKCGPACTSDHNLERVCDSIAAEILMPTGGVRSFANSLGKQSPEKLSIVASHFNVSLEAAARRLVDLNLWKWGTGMWDCAHDAQQVWFAGKRPWKTNKPAFAGFELALQSNTPVCANERFSRGPYTEPVALKAHHIGKNFVVAIVATRK